MISSATPTTGQMILSLYRRPWIDVQVFSSNLRYNHISSQSLFVESIDMVMPVMQYAPETCSWCEGTGKYGQYGDICLVCSGQGSVLVAQPSRICPHCGGTGTQQVGEFQDRCKICSGAGWAHVFKTSSPPR